MDTQRTPAFRSVDLARSAFELDGDAAIVCSECSLSKPPDAFHVVRGPMAVGDWRAQPCADCCRRRVMQDWARGLEAAVRPEGNVKRHAT
jgi:hypothetical protein